MNMYDRIFYYRIGLNKVEGLREDMVVLKKKEKKEKEGFGLNL